MFFKADSVQGTLESEGRPTFPGGGVDLLPVRKAERCSLRQADLPREGVDLSVRQANLPREGVDLCVRQANLPREGVDLCVRQANLPREGVDLLL